MGYMFANGITNHQCLSVLSISVLPMAHKGIAADEKHPITNLSNKSQFRNIVKK